MFRLTKTEHIDRVASEPETGMGYHLVFADVNGIEDRFLVFNCELVVSPKELPEVSYFLPEVHLDKISPVKHFKLIQLRPLSDLPGPTGGADTSGAPIAPSPRIVRKTETFEGFARVSAFSNDRRVTSTAGLRKGTYATTIADLRLVPSGFAAAGRYALPNPAAARYVYIVVPGAGHDIDGGTVRPAHQQAGGGVEVMFVNGAPDGSVLRPYRIPEL